jgi:hypothetical protein
MANEMKPSNNKLSSRTQCGDLGFCHYERSEVIQKQVLLAMRLLLSLRSIAMTRFAHKLWAMGLPRRAFSTARNDKKRVVRRLPRRAFSTARNDKFRVVIANAVWRSTSKWPEAASKNHSQEAVNKKREASVCLQ